MSKKLNSSQSQRDFATKKSIPPEQIAQAKQQYQSRKQQLCDQVKREGGVIRLKKKTSNLFRHRRDIDANRIDVSDFNHVIEINPEQGYVVVEGMITFAALVEATLEYGMLPAVVPELKTITVGGALVGVGIESSSFRYGLVHESVLAFEVLLADGTTIYCSPDNEHRDLFFGFANSYGTLGYALEVKLTLVPAKPYVCLQHEHYQDPDLFYQRLQVLTQDSSADGAIDFVDASIFSPSKMYITTGTMVEQVPYLSDYTYQNIFYRSIQQRSEDYLTIYDYIWRWDTDWFWCSKLFGAENPIIRRLYGKRRLNSRTYWRVMRWAKRNPLMRALQRCYEKPAETVIQDVCIPIDKAAEFFQFFNQEIGIKPVWNCPVRCLNPEVHHTMFPYQKDQLHINFGFWDMVPSTKEDGYYNRLVEKKVVELGGIKSLYSNAFYTPQEFWDIFDRKAYDGLKQRYDSKLQLGNLYQKCTEKLR